MINSKILGYTIKSLIGKGGMAEVYYAENTLGRAAAIKVLHESLLSQTEVKVRFENEARIMVSLDHPNIGKVYDVTEYNGRPAIIMEYLEGNTLSQALSKNQLTPGKLFDLFDQASQGLRYAHKKGVVHRDIKPSNLFLTTAGQLKILDFGIAKLEAYESHTLTGQTLGTMLYMSPEQVLDPKRVNYKTDIYSLGVTFFHLITGKPPYDVSTDSSFKIQSKIVQEELNLDKLTDEWYATLYPCLRKDPSTRNFLIGETKSIATSEFLEVNPVSIKSERNAESDWVPKQFSQNVDDTILYPPSNEKYKFSERKINKKGQRKIIVPIIIGSVCVLLVIILGIVVTSGSDLDLQFTNSEVETPDTYLTEPSAQILATPTDVKKDNVDPLKVESGSVENASKISQNNKDPKVYLISESQVDGVKKGAPLPNQGSFGEYRVESEVKEYRTNGVDKKYSTFIYYKSGETCFYVVPKFDHDIDEYINIIGKIYVDSDNYKTDKGIGVNSTIEEFIRAYPDYELWYASPFDVFVIKSKKSGLHFELNNDDYNSNRVISSEIEYLQSSEFKPNSKIIRIRI